MLFKSTRNSSLRIESKDAILQGISEDGGLFVPQEMPTLGDINDYLKTDYRGRAKLILSKFLTDFTDEELDVCINSAYSAEKFGSDDIAPVKTLSNELSILELWHGPTCAFKDMALQILPHFLTASLKKHSDKRALILVATSGDTGKAALEGFKDVDNTKILVFYPSDGVSNMQKLQMITQEGENVAVCGIKGNFDDAQTGVKAIFTGADMKKAVDEGGYTFSSANSINWGRLVPQIVYYVSAYCDLVNAGKIDKNMSMNVCVPTGNFGNILAAFYAEKMGLPIGKLICASNVNNVLTDFITTGVYDRNREFHTTISPSMDILISSNLERLIYALSDYDDAYVRELYTQLAKTGRFEVSEKIKERLRIHFEALYADDKETMNTIKLTYDRYGYVPDTHTAVAISAYNRYFLKTHDLTHTVLASTASPFKFPASVLEALGVNSEQDDFAQLKQLSEISKMPIPAQIDELKDKDVRFTAVCDPSEMNKTVLSCL